jgi:NIPSNAP
MRDLHKRFEDITLKVWKRHGIEALGLWEVAVGTSNELHQLLRWKDMGDREKRWAAFLADPEWVEGFAKSETTGPLVSRMQNQFWNPTSYSGLK